MKFEDFLIQARKQLDDFEVFWRAGMKNQPGDFPANLPPGDWDEQLNNFDMP